MVSPVSPPVSRWYTRTGAAPVPADKTGESEPCTRLVWTGSSLQTPHRRRAARASAGLIPPPSAPRRPQVPRPAGTAKANDIPPPASARHADLRRPAATGCASGCDLLTGPTVTPSTASFKLGRDGKPSAAAVRGRSGPAGHRQGFCQRTRAEGPPSSPGCPSRSHPRSGRGAGRRPGPGNGRHRCPSASTTGRREGVIGLDAVDSATRRPTRRALGHRACRPGPVRGRRLCGRGQQLGEILVFNNGLNRVSGVSRLTRCWAHRQGLVQRRRHLLRPTTTATAGTGSSPSSCPRAPRRAAARSPAASTSSNTCFEGIAATKGDSPFGPYNVYFVNSNYNSAEPGAPYLLNDFTKIAVSRDAFLMFYDEFPLKSPRDRRRVLQRRPGVRHRQERPGTGASRHRNGAPDRDFNVAIENMGTLATPDGTCARITLHQPGVACWYSVIPVLPPDPRQYDNSHGGSGFMLDSLDTYGTGDTRIAVFDWTGLSALNSRGPRLRRFGGQLFSGVDFYLQDRGLGAPQKAGPIPLGDECGAAKLVAPRAAPPPPVAPRTSSPPTATTSPRSPGAGPALGTASTEVPQVFRERDPRPTRARLLRRRHRPVRRSGMFSLTSEAYVSPAREDLTLPVIAAPISVARSSSPSPATAARRAPTTAGSIRARRSGGCSRSPAGSPAGPHRGPRAGADGRLHRVPGLPGSDPAALGRLQRGSLRPGQRQDLLRDQLHPLPVLHGLRVHPDPGHLRWHPGRLRQLGTS